MHEIANMVAKYFIAAGTGRGSRRKDLRVCILNMGELLPHLPEP
jgi:hypothetical protein